MDISSATVNKIMIVSLLLITLFFRLYRIEDVPLGVNNDAAWEGSAARAIALGNWTEFFPYAQDQWRGEPIIRITVAALTPLIGNTATTIKLASSIYGILLVPLFYLFLRKLFPATLAFLASWFVATSGWHIIMSRSGWRAITVPTITTLVWLTIYQAVTTKKRVWYCLTGGTLALTLYAYDAARVVPLVVIAAFGWMFCTSRAFRSIHARGSPLFFLSFIIVASPMMFYATIHWDTFIGRTTYLLVTEKVAKSHSMRPLVDNVRASSGLFTKRANGNDFFISEPLLDPPVVWLFPIGLVLSLWAAIAQKNKRQAFMLGWFLVSLLPAFLSHPNGNRAIGTIPSVYFFAAYGSIAIAEIIGSVIKKYLHIIRIILIIYIAGFVVSASYISYLGPVRREPIGFYPETFIVSSYLQTKLDTHDIYLTDNFPREILTYMLYKSGDPFISTYTWFPEKEQMLRVRPKEKRGIVFVLFPTQENTDFANQLLSRFPSSQHFTISYDTDTSHIDAALVIEVAP